jgi:hypothetical protein
MRLGAMIVIHRHLGSPRLPLSSNFQMPPDALEAIANCERRIRTQTYRASAFDDRSASTHASPGETLTLGVGDEPVALMAALTTTEVPTSSVKTLLCSTKRSLMSAKRW